MADKKYFTPEQLNDIFTFYSIDGYSMLKISKLFGVNQSVIKRVLIENNVEVRDLNTYKNKHCDETFFDVIDTEEKAYWLGFIYADGYVTKRKTQDTLGIKLSIDDKNHLEKFKESLKSEHSIGIYTSDEGYNVGKQYCSLTICNQHIVDSLIDKGVTYRKTKTLIFPTREQVPEKFVSHFIRGYFDGDGSIYHIVQGNSGCVSFTGTQNMLDTILTEIKQFVGTNAHTYKYSNKDIYDLKVGGRNQLKQFYEYIYKNSSVFLDRKKNKFEEILDIV